MVKRHPREVDEAVLAFLRYRNDQLTTIEQIWEATNLPERVIRRSVWRLCREGVVLRRRQRHRIARVRFKLVYQPREGIYA